LAGLCKLVLASPSETWKNLQNPNETAEKKKIIISKNKVKESKKRKIESKP